MARDAKGRDVYIATSEEIKAGKTTDVYFLRTLDILKKAGKDRTSVFAEVTAGNLPNEWPWGVLCGVRRPFTCFRGNPGASGPFRMGASFRRGRREAIQ